jgi:hypothetical protein
VCGRIKTKAPLCTFCARSHTEHESRSLADKALRPQQVIIKLSCVWEVRRSRACKRGGSWNHRARATFSSGLGSWRKSFEWVAASWCQHAIVTLRHAVWGHRANKSWTSVVQIAVDTDFFLKQKEQSKDCQLHWPGPIVCFNFYFRLWSVRLLFGLPTFFFSSWAVMESSLCDTILFHPVRKFPPCEMWHLLAVATTIYLFCDITPFNTGV